MTLENIESFSPEYKEIELLLVVDVTTQQLFLLKKGIIERIYSISTSVYGTGSEVNSYKTPLGKHKISEKIGEGLPEGAILKGRRWTGAIANIIKEPIDTEFDVVTSRILWLTGLEEGKNLGSGVDSKSRYIYIHGTAEEGLIGKPASDGCVRMYNSDVITLFDTVNVDTEVWII
ncbi:MAG: L,D-transpeptidase [SAR86 cluster bacterium]|jgi:lipoprotein-anchoring transpeptidase ErfK/SrfK|nr:L,D-transpeptidase [SAR86 cluster bacterium]